MASLTDTFGRTILIATSNGQDTYSLVGITVSFPTGTPQAQALAAIEGMAPADYAPPAPPTIFTFQQFMALFTSAEQEAVVNSTDVQVKLFILSWTGSNGFTLNNAEVVNGVNYLASSGVITAARATTILAGQAPT
jgi:hypothetical protein